MNKVYRVIWSHVTNTFYCSLRACNLER
ncbi:hypothetical protein CDE51_07430 [Pasteurella multocida]|nr:hypothetical protein CDE51_07430 [Pasteurella multocida]